MNPNRRQLIRVTRTVTHDVDLNDGGFVTASPTKFIVKFPPMEVELPSSVPQGPIDVVRAVLRKIDGVVG